MVSSGGTHFYSAGKRGTALVPPPDPDLSRSVATAGSDGLMVPKNVKNMLKIVGQHGHL